MFLETLVLFPNSSYIRVYVYAICIGSLEETKTM